MLHDFYPTPNIVRMIKLRGIKWVSHAVRTEEKCIPSSAKGKRLLEKLRHGRNDSIKWILRK